MAESFYKLLNREERNPPAQLENEVRIKSSGDLNRYVKVITGILTSESYEAHRSVLVSGIGLSIPVVVSVVERVRSTVPGVHSVVETRKIEVEETYSPKVEGLAPVTRTRYLSNLAVRLAMRPINVRSVGYQAPRPFEEQDRRREVSDSPEIDSSSESEDARASRRREPANRRERRTRERSPDREQERRPNRVVRDREQRRKR